MKKLAALVLVLAMMLTSCASGGTPEQTEEIADNPDVTVTEAPTEEVTDDTNSQEEAVPEEKKIQFEVEDFKAEMKDGKIKAKVKIRNLADKQIDSVHVHYQVLDENGDALAASVCSYDAILAGQAAWMEPIISFSDLDMSEVRGICFVDIGYRDNSDLQLGGNTKYNFADYISEIKTDTEIYSLNDTVETDTVKLTVSEFFYEDKLIGDVFDLGKLNPNDGEIWACIGLTLENIGKSQIKPYDALTATIDYNDGYKYSTEESTAVIIQYPDMDAYYYKAGGKGMQLNPLTSGQFVLAISCAPKLREDTESPINIIFELPSESGTKTYTYKVQ